MIRCTIAIATVWLAGCSAGAPASAVTSHTDRGITIWTEGESKVVEFFQTHRCMVAPFTSVKRTAEGWDVQTDYPSVNFGRRGEGHLFSHVVKVTNPRNVPIDPAKLEPRKICLVLLSVSRDAGGRDEYELLGTAEPGEHMKAYFEGREELWFKGE